MPAGGGGLRCDACTHTLTRSKLHNTPVRWKVTKTNHRVALMAQVYGPVFARREGRRCVFNGLVTGSSPRSQSHLTISEVSSDVMAVLARCSSVDVVLM